MDIRRIARWMGIAVVAWALLPAVAGAQPELRRLTIGTARDLQLGAEIGIAKHKGFFQKEGLDVTIAYFTSGAEMTSAMAAGRLQMGSFGDFPVVNMMAGGLPIKVIAAMAEISGTQQVVVRKGIRTPQDLVGKKIGLTVGSSAEALLTGFLEHYKVPKGSVEILNMRPPEQVAALARGDIDGLTVWQPFALRAKKQAGGHALASAIRSFVPGREGPLAFYAAYALLAVRESFLKSYPRTVEAALRAMINAQRYINKNLDEAARTMEKDMRQPLADLKIFMRENIYDMSVTPKLARTVQRTIDFTYKAGKIKSKPRLDDFLELAPLKKVAPGMVRYEPKR